MLDYIIKTLKKNFYLFDFEENETHLKVSFGNRTVSLPKSDTTRITSELLPLHSAEVMRVKLLQQYPDIYTTVKLLPEGFCVTGVWVCRDERSDEGLAHDMFYLDSKESYSRLEELNNIAGQAKKEGYFYCCGHKQVESKHQGMYHWFAGKFCENYGKENPWHKNAADKETYN